MVAFVEAQLRDMKRCRGWETGQFILRTDGAAVTSAAFLLDTCNLLALLPTPATLGAQILCLRSVSHLLVPSSSSSTSTSPSPNDHVLALRCLSALPKAMWDDQLGDTEMGVIMEGLNSPDDSVRRLVCFPELMVINALNCKPDPTSPSPAVSRAPVNDFR